MMSMFVSGKMLICFKNFNEFFMYLFRRRKGGDALMQVYVWELIVIAFTTELP